MRSLFLCALLLVCSMLSGWGCSGASGNPAGDGGDGFEDGDDGGGGFEDGDDGGGGGEVAHLRMLLVSDSMEDLRIDPDAGAPPPGFILLESWAPQPATGFWDVPAGAYSFSYGDPQQTATWSLEADATYTAIFHMEDGENPVDLFLVQEDPSRTVFLNLFSGAALTAAAPNAAPDSVALAETVDLPPTGTVALRFSGGEQALTMGTGTVATVMVLGGRVDLVDDPVLRLGQFGPAAAEPFPGGDGHGFRAWNLAPAPLPQGLSLLTCASLVCTAAPVGGFCEAVGGTIPGEVRALALLWPGFTISSLLETHQAAQEVEAVWVDDRDGTAVLHWAGDIQSFGFTHLAEGVGPVQLFDASAAPEALLGTVSWGETLPGPITATSLRVDDGTGLVDLSLEPRLNEPGSGALLLDTPAGPTFLRTLQQGGCFFHGDAAVGESCTAEACDPAGSCLAHALDQQAFCAPLCADPSECAAEEVCIETASSNYLVSVCVPGATVSGSFDAGVTPAGIADLTVPIDDTEVVFSQSQIITGGLIPATNLILWDMEGAYELGIGGPQGGGITLEGTQLVSAKLRRLADQIEVMRGSGSLEIQYDAGSDSYVGNLALDLQLVFRNRIPNGALSAF